MDLNDHTDVGSQSIDHADVATREHRPRGRQRPVERSRVRHARVAARVAGHADRRFLGAPAERPDRARGQDRRYLQRDRRGQRADGVRARACRPGGGARGQDPDAGEVRAAERFVGGDGGLGQRPDRRPAVADHRGDACHHRGGAGRSAADGAARRRWPAAAGRVPPAGDDRQHDDQAAVGVHLRGDARGARGRHRRQAGRPGAGAAR